MRKYVNLDLQKLMFYLFFLLYFGVENIFGGIFLFVFFFYFGVMWPKSNVVEEAELLLL